MKMTAGRIKGARCRVSISFTHEKEELNSLVNTLDER